jgi:hypothetical protein
MSLGRLPLIVSLVVLLAGFKEVTQIVPGQPNDERAAQDALPHSQSPLWATLGKCPVSFNEHKGVFSIQLTPDVKQMDGKSIDANGFVLPLDGSDNTRHFLLTKRTPVCLFCPPGEPNEVIEVRSKKTIAWGDDLITMKGRFKLTNNGEKGVFFTLMDAEPIR